MNINFFWRKFIQFHTKLFILIQNTSNFVLYFRANQGLTMKKFLWTTFALFLFLLIGCSDNSKLANRVFGINDLKHKKVGVQIGNTADIYTTDFGRDTAKIQVERYSKLADAIQALKQGKIEAILCDNQPAIAFVKKNPSLDILEEVFVEETYAGVIAKKNTSLLDSVNLAFEQLKVSGIYDSIINTYINETSNFHYIPKTKNAPKLVLATNAQFPPYEFHTANGIEGIDIEIAYFIADFLGRELEIQDMEFDAIINAVNSGKADIGLAGFTITEERKQSINFTTPYANSKIVIVVRKNSSSEQSLSIKELFYNNLIKDSRWKFIVEGLGNTLIISLFAALLGVFIGTAISFIRCTNEVTGRLKILNRISMIYLAIIRGTPVMVQLLIIYYVIFSSVNVNKILVAIIAFGINSGAYVSEILRSGFKAIDPGQVEAGRSLGLKFGHILRHITFPQAFKNSLPAMTNEFITLIKETSICGYIGLTDLTRGGDIIRSLTYEAMLPLLIVAAIYFIMVAGLSTCVARLEKRLKKNER